jgi:hypothetical protein
MFAPILFKYVARPGPSHHDFARRDRHHHDDARRQARRNPGGILAAAVKHAEEYEKEGQGRQARRRHIARS